MLRIPAEGLEITSHGELRRYSSVGPLVFSDTFVILPEDVSRPVINAEVGMPEPDTISFELCGKVAVPLAGDVSWITVNGMLVTQRETDGSLSVLECDAAAQLTGFELAIGTLLSSGSVRLYSCQYHTHVVLEGVVCHSCGNGSSCVKTNGTLKAEVAYDSRKTGMCAIRTLLTDTHITANGMTLHGGTIRLDLFSGPEDHERFPLPYDENDELLFQFEQPLSLGMMRIEGIPGSPVTISVSLTSTEKGKTALFLSFFPSRLVIPYIGDRTVLFIHGNHYDEPFTIAAEGSWNASISSNIFLQLIAPEDPSRKPLIEGTAALCGTIAGNGFDTPAIELHAELTGGVAFPATDRPHSLPAQNIAFSAGPGSAASFSVLTGPLSIEEMTINPGTDSWGLLHAELHPGGLLFRGILVCSGQNRAERVSEAIIRGDCTWFM